MRRFDSPVALTHLHMWNHLSNGVASNPDYAVSLFNLTLLDADDHILFSLANQSAIGTAGFGQQVLHPCCRTSTHAGAPRCDGSNHNR